MVNVMDRIFAFLCHLNQSRLVCFLVSWFRLFEAPVIALKAFNCSSVNLGVIFRRIADLRTHSDLLIPAIFALCKTLLCSLSSKRTLILNCFLFSSAGLPPFSCYFSSCFFLAVTIGSQSVLGSPKHNLASYLFDSFLPDWIFWVCSLDDVKIR